MERRGFSEKMHAFFEASTDAFDEKRGRYDDWQRKKDLRQELRFAGVYDASREDIVGILSTADVRRLRKIHALASYGDIGSIGVYFFSQETQDEVRDVRDSSYTVKLSPGDTSLQLDFTPLMIKEKSERFSEEVMLLGAIDLLSVITNLQGRTDKPKIIEGFTNPTLAKFMLRLGFHPFEGVIENGDEEETMSNDQLIETLHEKPSRADAHSEKLLGMFIKKEDLLSEEMIAKVEGIRDIMYSRLGSILNHSFSQQNLSEVEKQARAIAIGECIRNGTLE